MVTEEGLAPYNVVGVYRDVHSARRIVASLEREEIPSEHISFLSKGDDDAGAGEAGEANGPDGVDDVAAGSVKGGAAGGAVGGAAGFLTGLIAFGIPGVGPVVGVGVWATALGGAVAGATAGGVAGGISTMWDTRYRDAVAEGRVLVGVHSADPDEIETAVEALRREDAERIDRLDQDGRPVD